MLLPANVASGREMLSNTFCLAGLLVFLCAVGTQGAPLLSLSVSPAALSVFNRQGVQQRCSPASPAARPDR